MNDKSIFNKYSPGDVYIIRDKRPTDGTNGKHPYLVISNDEYDNIMTLPISSVYIDLCPIFTYDSYGRECYSWLNPFRVYPQNIKYLETNSQFAFRVTNEYLKFVVGLFLSRFIEDYEAKDRMARYSKEFFLKYHDLPSYHKLEGSQSENVRTKPYDNRQLINPIQKIEPKTKEVITVPRKTIHRVAKKDIDDTVLAIMDSEEFAKIDTNKIGSKTARLYSLDEATALVHSYEKYGRQATTIAFEFPNDLFTTTKYHSLKKKFGL